MFRQDIGIDLGTATVLIFMKNKGIVLQEPSVVTLDKTTGEVVKIGREAQEMLGRTPNSIVAIRPLRDGVISDYHTTEKMLRYFIKGVSGLSLFRPRVVVCVPSGITEVENKAVIDAAYKAGASRVQLIEEPMAAAIGAGLDVAKPVGNMVVDVGGGTTDIAVISFGDIVVSNSVKMAGDKFDEAIIRYVRKKYNVLIGERTAEEIKLKAGCMVARKERVVTSVRGRCLLTGLPKEFEIDSDKVMEALDECGQAVAEAVHSVLEKTPPELVADIYSNGIVMTGGGSLIYGFDQMLSERLGIKIVVAEDAVSCVAKGTGEALKHLGAAQSRN